MKKLIAILFGLTITIATWGAKAYPEPLTITQKDGKPLTYRLHGDENLNYATTTDGVLLYQEHMDFYVAVINEDGEMLSSGVLAHNAGQRTDEEIALIGQQDKEKFFTAAMESQAKNGLKKLKMQDNTTTLFPHTGNPTALVILADFQDQPFKHDDQTTKEIFDLYLNATGRPSHSADATLKNNYGSVASYFKDMSGGLFVPKFDVAALVHLSGNMVDYGKGKNDDMGKFIPEVCTLAHEQGVDFSKYDANNDGYVDLVYIIYAGYGQSTGAPEETIWPKSGPTNGTAIYCTFDGKNICRYGVNPELLGNPTATEQQLGGTPYINGIGLFCHEFSHCMGLPDLYPTNESAQKAGNPAMEYWDLMDGGEYGNNGYYPTAYTAWEREYMGWMEMETLTSDMAGQSITLKAIDTSGGKAYKIYPDDDATGNEYIYLQNIQPLKWNYWLGNALGHGMVVNYVNYDQTAFSLAKNTVNNVVGKSRMTIVPADGLLISSYLSGTGQSYTMEAYRTSHGGDPFPGTGNVHELQNVPLWDGKVLELPLLNIEESNQLVTFSYLSDPTKIATGIENIGIRQPTKGQKVYTLDGRYVGTSLRGLSKGIYVINGKKTVIR